LGNLLDDMIQVIMRGQPIFAANCAAAGSFFRSA
jgi:hypothetical protein